jgi:hypothetical protein
MTPLRPRIHLFLSLMLPTAGLLAAAPAQAQPSGDVNEMPPYLVGSERTVGLELKLGAFRPLIDREPGLTATPYRDTFSDRSMLLFEASLERQLFQAFGTAGVGAQAGYAEIFAFARTATGEPAAESTGLRLVPLRAFGVYRFDYAAQRWNVPLVPYAKLGLHYTIWMVTKGSGLEQTAAGQNALGGRWGYGLTAGLSLLLDFFEPRMARDFDTDLGVNHSYLFAEYNLTEVTGFGSPGLDLSGRYFMFGVAFEI